MNKQTDDQSMKQPSQAVEKREVTSIKKAIHNLTTTVSGTTLSVQHLNESVNNS